MPIPVEPLLSALTPTRVLRGLPSLARVRNTALPLAIIPWFLFSGVWDVAKVWLDDVPWNPMWFLASGRWSATGAWRDDAAWNAGWFLSSGSATPWGVWLDSEVWA